VVVVVVVLVVVLFGGRQVVRGDGGPDGRTPTEGQRNVTRLAKLLLLLPPGGESAGHHLLPVYCICKYI
jgi:hypothetical protein